MPRNLSDLITISKSDPTITSSPVVEPIKEIEYPEHLFTDSELVGYINEISHEQFFNFAFNGIDLTTSSILDMGCGRGDLYRYLNDRFTNVIYTGIDVNQILIEVGKRKYPGINLINTDWMNFTTDSKFDWVVNIFGNAMIYTNSFPEDKWQYLIGSIEKALSLCNQGLIFIILSNNGGVEQYLQYEISELCKHLEGKYLFGIDSTNNYTSYKLFIQKT